MKFTDSNHIPKEPENNSFLIIFISKEELAEIGSPCMCDNCNKYPPFGYFIAVLNSWFCSRCFKNWTKKAKYYPQDAPKEKENYNRMQQKLSASIKPNLN